MEKEKKSLLMKKWPKIKTLFNFYDDHVYI